MNPRSTTGTGTPVITAAGFHPNMPPDYRRELMLAGRGCDAIYSELNDGRYFRSEREAYGSTTMGSGIHMDANTHAKAQDRPATRPIRPWLVKWFTKGGAGISDTEARDFSEACRNIEQITVGAICIATPSSRGTQHEARP